MLRFILNKKLMIIKGYLIYKNFRISIKMTLYISNVYFPSGGQTESDLNRLFDPYGGRRNFSRITIGPISGPNIYRIYYNDPDRDNVDLDEIITDLNGYIFNGHLIVVSEDRPPPSEFSRSNMPISGMSYAQYGVPVPERPSQRVISVPGVTYELPVSSPGRSAGQRAPPGSFPNQPVFPFMSGSPISSRRAPNILVPEQPTSNTQDELFKQSYQTLLKQLYGLKVELPQFLVINGIRANFISFQEASLMLNQSQIERYLIDPILQPWAGVPGALNRIITLFGKNGITYLAKVKYDSQTNQIYAPV